MTARGNRWAGDAAGVPLLVALVVMVIWGGTPVATRIATEDLDPIVVAFARTVVGGLLALPLLAAMSFGLPERARHRWLLAASAVSGFVAFPILFTLGQERTSAMHGGIILAGLPIVTGIYSALVERRRPSRLWFIGCAVALAGETMLVALRTDSADEAPLIGDLLVVLSALVVATGYVAGARLAASGYPSLATTLYGILAGALLLAVPAIVLLAGSGFPSGSTRSWAAVAVLATVTSIVGYVGWYWALARGGVARISTLQFLMPVSGVVLAALILDERLTLPLAVAAVTILAGVAIAQRR
ncbi:MAG: DMT family transporter [Actinobacteria bacterium]|nr:DMT family transporter [Actinomycetota bacterium]